ncbi:MAG TPA: hypothetical protein VFE17_03360 [Candidatus Baltobacteraceae bacterium]|jgi:hypothetical protein|nr:hypothetical protein [Candidatus Baltobacteraceae bacterium]
MNKYIVRTGLAALALSGMLVSAAEIPAKADTTTTQNIIYGAAAAAAALTLYNVEHKHALATNVQGYLPDGSTVYQDGHVVSANGQTWYPGNNGQSVACSNQYCTISGGNNGGYYGYNNGGYNGYNNGSYNGYNNGGYNGYSNGRYNGYNNTAYNGYSNGTYRRSDVNAARRNDRDDRNRNGHGRS